MDSQRSFLEIVCLSMSEQLHHMLQVVESVIDRRRCQHEHRFPLGDLEHATIARRPGLAFALYSGIPKVMRFIDENYVSSLPDIIQPFLVTTAVEVCMTEDLQIREGTAEVRQIPLKHTFPHRLSGSLGNEQRHPLAIMFDKPLYQHQPNECFAQADAITEKCSFVFRSDL